jgi:hypothetical protein
MKKMKEILNTLIVGILESWKLCVIALLASTGVILIFLSLTGHPSNSTNQDWFHFDSSHWTVICIGIIGSLASTFAFIAASKIFQLSNASGTEMSKIVMSIEKEEKDNKELLNIIKESEKTNQEILKEVKQDEDLVKKVLSKIEADEEKIKDIVHNLSFVTQRIEDALRTQPYELGNIFKSLHDFFKNEIDNIDFNTEFLWLGDTSSVGELHEVFNTDLKNTHPEFLKQCEEIRFWLMLALKRSGKFQVGLLDYLDEEIDVNLAELEAFDKIKTTRLVKKFVIPILDSLKIDYQQKGNLRQVYRFLNNHRVFNHKILSYVDGEDKTFQPVRHFPYQVFVLTNNTTKVYRAFLVHVGTYNMMSVKNARALITFDEGLVITLKNVVQSFLIEQKQKIERDIELNERVKRLKSLIKSDETETMSLVLDIYQLVQGNK